MRVEGSVTSVSWIPSASVTGAVYAVPFETGIGHYDDPPPDVLASVDTLLQSDGARFVNDLRAWIDVDEGVIIGHSHCGHGQVGATRLRLGRHDVTLAAMAMPTRRRTERLGPDAVRFMQTAGARTGAPYPRRVNRAPFVQLAAPLAWTTLSLTLRADGTHDFRLSGASPFPRHWLYNGDNRLVAKSAVIDYKRWTTDIFGGHTPWGGADSPAFVADAESSLERELSVQIMRPEARHTVRRLHAGDRLTEQGEPGNQVFLLLDGVLRVDVDGTALADIGPGSVLGERASLEEGHRTASLTPVTRCTVAAVSGGFVDTRALQQLAQTHNREAQTC